MLKAELVKEVAKGAGESHDRVRRVLESLDRVVKNAVSGGQSVMLFGLGKIVQRRRGERTARNMATGAAVVVPPHTVVALRPSDSLLAAANRKG